jgi:hypothetical protein
MQTATIFLEAGWDFIDETENGTDDIWKIVEGQTYPLLSWQKYGGGTGKPNDPYLIYTAEHLNALGAEPNDYDKHFKLMADIDLSGYVYDRAVIAADTDTRVYRFGESVSDGIPFSGVFDGGNHTISNLMIVGENNLGFFGELTDGAHVSNLGIVDANIVGGSNTGSLAGLNYRGTIISCYSSGTVDGESVTGGLVGVNGGDIIASYSIATVSGVGSAGGLVGHNFGSITDSYSRGPVFGSEMMYSSAGGLVAVNRISTPWGGWLSGTVAECYSAGIVTGGSYAGGCLGSPDSFFDEGTENCFWDTESSYQPESYGGTGLTTAEMQTAATFLDAGWDFIDETENGTEDIWWILDGQDYPRLWWELGDEEVGE